MNKQTTTRLRLAVLVSVILVPLQAMAAEAEADPQLVNQILSNALLIFGLFAILIAIIVLLQVNQQFMQMTKLRVMEEHGVKAPEKVAKPSKESIFSRLYKRWTKAVPVEQEEDILFDHEYDGIRELDNSLPPWWVALFYFTIIFGVVYLVYYHVGPWGMSSREQFAQKMEMAEEAKARLLASQGNLINESNVEQLFDEASLAEGKEIYMANCVSCHGTMGEGGIGPNFTDQYWIHGGDIKDLFSTVKNGVIQKGMQSWEKLLRPTDIQKVSSYILSLQGTDPPNQKEPEGELYEPESAEEESDPGALGSL